MRHHGAPTRLLDWSTSIFVAAYFAIEELWDTDGAIWVFNGGRLRDWSLAERERLIESGELPLELWPVPASWNNELLTSPMAPQLVLPSELGTFWATRMVTQQGQFTVSTNVLTDHTDGIAQAFRGSGAGHDLDCCKLIVPAGLKPTFLQQLRAMNVNAASLFPTIDGFGRSIDADVRLDAHLRR
jgi:FRG domain-containing protein